MTIEQIIACAEGTRNYPAFAEDMRKCDTAMTMCGLPAIKAEAWLITLRKMTPADIYYYVDERYFPGALNPFEHRT